MIKLSKLLLGSILLLLVGCGDGEPNYPVLNLSDAANQQQTDIRFSQLRGKVVFINYWAEWCKPCRTEMPELNAFQKQMADQVKVLAVNFDGVQGEQLAQQAEAMGIEFTVITKDPMPQFGLTPSGVLPETLVFDQQGVFHKVLLGPQTISKLEQVVAALNKDHSTP